MNIESKDDGRRDKIGYPDSCAYCYNSPGEPHKPDCHVPQKTVVVELTVRMVIDMPRVWDADMINFSMNDSSACTSRYFDQLFVESNQSPNLCTTCHRTEMTYLRDATENDHETFHYIPENLYTDIKKRVIEEF